jgi:hypothetical protein
MPAISLRAINDLDKKDREPLLCQPLKQPLSIGLIVQIMDNLPILSVRKMMALILNP